ncbi:enoyl-CoA hydratase [Limnohabitans sp. Jir61]|uniref:enoyl-CoA hydratase n=1 Tax=Limnohabitans sp. Jir61 TaxID=1826168 RepID=UPI000D3DA6BF|nr:enoyl-CoA hydratase [Limnohabitans sp. Jir61]PUE32768.1 enoyl-CoA hydratase [Limnohabitans sp. Jir61]
MREPHVDLVLHSSDACGVHQICLNQPDAFNVLSSEAMHQLQVALDAIAKDEQARVVVISAKGRAFCAGHDLREMRASPSLDYYKTLFHQCSRMMMSVQRLPVPVMAVVDGIATAAGCQLVAMCDLAVASQTSKFAVSGVNLGLFCATPSVALSRNLSRKAAFEMLVTGDFISAEQALVKGLVNSVVPSAELEAMQSVYVSSILAKPRKAIAIGKKLFYEQLEQPIEAAYLNAENAMACNMMDDSALEGVQAFIDKRKPAWKP